MRSIHKIAKNAVGNPDKNKSPRLLLQSPAFLWDGFKQLEGILELWESALIFHFKDFNNSNLNLHIKMSDIESAQTFMIFNIAKNGLKIISRDDKVDLFVLENCREFCLAILEEIDKQ